jgi:outer membrane protein TolC
VQIAKPEAAAVVLKPEPTAQLDGSAEANQPAPTGAKESTSSVPTRKSTPGLAVTSSRDGFWRAGRQWTKATTTIRLSELTDEQADQLVDEPMLTVAYVEDVAQALQEGGE